MDEYRFEKLVADLWEADGWDTRVTSGSGDKGIDIIATRDDPFKQKCVIQAKRYSKNNKIGSNEVRKYATLHQQERDADFIIIITTSEFTKDAIEIADNLKMKMINGTSLCRLIVERSDEDVFNKYFTDTIDSETRQMVDESVWENGTSEEYTSDFSSGREESLQDDQGWVEDTTLRYLDDNDGSETGTYWERAKSDQE